MRFLRSLAHLALLLGYLFIALPLLLVVGRTRRGRAVGVVTVTFAAPFAALGLQRAGYTLAENFEDLSAPSAVFLGVWLAAFTGCYVYIFATLRRYHQNPAGGLWSVDPRMPAERPSVWRTRGPQGPPETDLVRLAVAVVTRLDPLMSWGEARRIRRVMRPLLAEMDADPGYTELYPPYIDQFHAWVRGRPLVDHGFAYTPTPRPDRPGVLIFLHGHGPNVALNLHVWRAFADRHGLAIFCPTFGYGNWEHPDGVTAVQEVLEGALKWSDPARVYLAGISQGGAGVARAAAALPDRFAGLLLLSPTVEPAVVGELAAAWRGKPVYVAQGGRDHNVRPGPVTAAVETLRAGGADVKYRFEPDADHFLFFAEREAIQREIGEWLPSPTR